MSIKADGTVNHMRCYLDYKNDRLCDVCQKIQPSLYDDCLIMWELRTNHNDKREQCPNVKLCDDFECKLNNNKCNPTPDCIDYIARG